jgi:hypothetical protein
MTEKLPNLKKYRNAKWPGSPKYTIK